MLAAFTNKDNSMKAFHALKATLERNGSTVQSTVGFQGGNTQRLITWHAKEGIWSLLDERAKSGDRFWCLFGVEDPHVVSNLNITVEINPRHTGTDMRVAGAFAHDAEGAVHLCHNGKIGGGRPGVSKRGFWEHYRGDWTQMAYNGRRVRVVELGSILDERILKRLGLFAKEVGRIKGILATSGRA